ncbi:MAG: formimidoylglutamase [Bacteroidales bacterium]|nr:formimidoylglutamase [Bacteroidales bacterium]
MDLSPFFEAVDFDRIGFPNGKYDAAQLVGNVCFFDPEGSVDLEGVEFAILGVPESRNAVNNSSCSMAPDEIRSQFYRLYCWDKPVKILDLGNLILGETVEDTYQVLSDILSYLIENKIIPIIMGGSNDLAYANYRAYEKLEQLVNIVAVDARFDLGNEEGEIRSDCYLNKIVLQEPNYLLNYANIGYQTYMNSPESIHLMNQLHFETYRVGMMRQEMEEVEAIVRNAEMMSIDISAVRRPDAPGNPNASSNGFYGEEICQVARFAGVSDKLSSIGIYEYDPTLDSGFQTAQLIGHVLWYFIEGYLNRQGDIFFKDRNMYIRYSVPVSESIDEMEFYFSKKTGRWWVVVPVINIKKDLEQRYFLPCSKKDYETACKDKIPDRWWRAYHKLNR